MCAFNFLREAEYAQRMREEVLPALLAARRESRFQTKDGAALFVVRYEAEAPRGSVVILHGFGECVEKYRELCYYFLKSGLTVLAFEQRGHGRSAREVEPGLIYIKRFSQYVEDFAALMACEAEHLPTPRYLYAHSMGGAVAALYLERHPGFFDKAVLSSPMIAMQYKNAPRWAGYTACVLLGSLGLNKRRFMGMKKAPAPEAERVEGSGAGSRARFACHRDVKMTDPLLWSSRPTFAWIREALGCTRQILKKGAPERIDIPVRVYAAEREMLVLEGPQRALAARIPQGEFFLVPGAKHELYFAEDEILHPYLSQILDFFR